MQTLTDFFDIDVPPRPHEFDILPVELRRIKYKANQSGYSVELFSRGYVRVPMIGLSDGVSGGRPIFEFYRDGERSLPIYKRRLASLPGLALQCRINHKLLAMGVPLYHFK